MSPEADLRNPVDVFWHDNQPGFRFSDKAPGTPEFFAEVTRHRYALEPHIPELAQFEQWRALDVLEVGCGIATDGAEFARAGARYEGLDPSSQAVDLARRRFEQEGLSGTFEVGSATALPYEDECFDLVYSHGVIHHIDQTEAAVGEFQRVLRPQGIALVMLYHRNSFNHRVTISLVRRAFAVLLLVPGGQAILARLVPEGREMLSAHRELLSRHGLRYLTDQSLFLSNNTDGPGNPMSKVFSRAQARTLFAAFADVETHARYLNLRLYPRGELVARLRMARRLERRFGWHLYVIARK